jgi:hypothetical protein
MGKPIPLDLDHINGKPHDHRLENLRLLCRNCHAQTDTFCGKNIKNSCKARATVRMSKNKRIAAQKAEYDAEQQKYVELVKTSGIDFSTFGWVTQVSKIVNQKPQKVNAWMKRFMPDFYKEHCFKRGSV